MSTMGGKKTTKNTNIWRLNNAILNNQQIREEIKQEIKICIETNENESTTTPNLWDSVKAVLRGKKKESEVAQLCPTLCDPTKGSVAYKAPLSMGFSRQEYWSGLLFPSSAKGKVHSKQAYLKKQEKNQINNLTLHLKQLEKEMKNPRVGRGKK